MTSWKCHEISTDQLHVISDAVWLFCVYSLQCNWQSWLEAAMSYPPYGAPGGYPPQGPGQPGYPVTILYCYSSNVIHSILWSPDSKSLLLRLLLFIVNAYTAWLLVLVFMNLCVLICVLCMYALKLLVSTRKVIIHHVKTHCNISKDFTKKHFWGIVPEHRKLEKKRFL